MNIETKEVVRGIIEYYNCKAVDYSEVKELIELVSDKVSDDFYIDWNGEEYRIIHDDAIWSIYVEGIEELTKDCYLGGAVDLPDWIEIDWEKTAENTIVDGYGHHFSSYDGGEVETNNYHIFRVN